MDFYKIDFLSYYIREDLARIMRNMRFISVINRRVRPATFISRRHLAPIERSSTVHDAYLFSTSIGNAFHADLCLDWQIQDKSSPEARHRQV